MMLRHHWTPSSQVRGTVKQLGAELVFPLVFDDKDRPGYKRDDTITTTFGLWFIHPVTGEERSVTAPFFLESTYGGAHKYKWRVFSAEDGTLIASPSFTTAAPQRAHQTSPWRLRTSGVLQPATGQASPSIVQPWSMRALTSSNASASVRRGIFFSQQSFFFFVVGAARPILVEQLGIS